MTQFMTTETKSETERTKYVSLAQSTCIIRWYCIKPGWYNSGGHQMVKGFEMPPTMCLTMWDPHGNIFKCSALTFSLSSPHLFAEKIMSNLKELAGFVHFTITCLTFYLV